MVRGFWCLVVLAVLMASCNGKGERENRDQKTHEELMKGLDGEIEAWKKPSAEPLKPVVNDGLLLRYSRPQPRPWVDLPGMATPVELAKAATLHDGEPRDLLETVHKSVHPSEFLEGDPSPYLKFNVSDRVGRSQYSLKRIKMLQRICSAKSVEGLEMCLGEQIDILLMHVEALEKENERRHKATAKFRNAIKKKR